jgi:hypothetical protein
VPNLFPKVDGVERLVGVLRFVAAGHRVGEVGEVVTTVRAANGLLAAATLSQTTPSTAKSNPTDQDELAAVLEELRPAAKACGAAETQDALAALLLERVRCGGERVGSGGLCLEIMNPLHHLPRHRES